ncbi:hypothetical protein CMV_003515 [Castanea mollissima]|uniref:Myb/SANT-like domain-containing protein n=1 Tax=Castanea mollissima TaxID=60419 RepID=A0A8J4W2X9_9ROSI|nr:hypothetical protein CMV_003515 [Castanea mollissima]
MMVGGRAKELGHGKPQDRPVSVKRVFLVGNFAQGVPRDLVWDVITQTLNSRTRKDFHKRQVMIWFCHLQRWYCQARGVHRFQQKQHKWSQLLKHTGLGLDETTQIVTGPGEVWAHVVAGDQGAANLWKKGCPDYDKLKQLFALSTATGHLQISSNTPALTSDEERALEEELANDGAVTHVYEDCYTPNLESIPLSTEETGVDDQTQVAGKRPMQDTSAKGKKVSKKADKVSEMIVALKEYTAMTRERYSGKKGKSSGTSEQFAQFAAEGDPCSLGKAIAVLNQYEDIRNKAYVKISKAL